MSPSARNVALAALSCAAVVASAHASNFDLSPPPWPFPMATQRPPEAYQKPAQMIVRTLEPMAATQYCAAALGGEQAYGCVYLGVTVLPNPCAFRGDPFADLVCHEQAHVGGWPANHPRSAPR